MLRKLKKAQLLKYSEGNLSHEQLQPSPLFNNIESIYQKRIISKVCGATLTDTYSRATSIKVAAEYDDGSFTLAFV